MSPEAQQLIGCYTHVVLLRPGKELSTPISERRILILNWSVLG